MAGKPMITTDHDVIRKWVEARGGRPTRAAGTGGENDPGMLRIDFPGYRGAKALEPISWDEFFRKFDEKNLAFLYQDTTAQGKESRFFKFISRETAEKRQKEAAAAASK